MLQGLSSVIAVILPMASVSALQGSDLDPSSIIKVSEGLGHNLYSEDSLSE